MHGQWHKRWLLSIVFRESKALRREGRDHRQQKPYIAVYCNLEIGIEELGDLGKH
jgi:hypothetical protein